MSAKKGFNRESFVQKFPDSERGEMKPLASFLGADIEEEIDEANVRSFKMLQEITQSPTKGDKSPFCRSRRATLEGTEEVEDEGIKETKEVLPRGVTEKSPKEGKATIFGKMLAKHRNKSGDFFSLQRRAESAESMAGG